MAVINRRPHPILISGIWDLAGLIFACSGLLLAAGPAMVMAFKEREERRLLFSDPLGVTSLAELWQGSWMWILYYLTILSLLFILFLTRRKTSVIYNITPFQFENVLANAMSDLSKFWQRSGNRIIIETPESNGKPQHFSIDFFPLFHNVTIKWHDLDRQFRSDLEHSLEKELSSVHAQDNPSANWLFGIAASLFGMIIVSVGLMILLILLLPR